MIFIIDNGESYSSHEVYFAETDMPADFVRRYIGEGYGGDAHVVAISDGTEWHWVASGPCSLLDFSAWGDNDADLVAEFYAKESPRVLRKYAAREEEYRLGCKKEHAKRSQPGHRYRVDQLYSPRTPAIDALVARGELDPLECKP